MRVNLPDDDPPPPPGVVLRDPEDSETLRKDLEDSVAAAMQRYAHGYSYGGVRLELGDLKYIDRDKFTLKEQKDALMNDQLLYRRLRGTVRLVDEASNQVLDERKGMTLMKVPWLTPRGTFINNGSEFSPIMQSRLLPGAYTRQRDNGELESHFNVRPGTGSAMRVSFDPGSTQYRLKVGSSDLHAYSVFKDLGVSDEELERRWGPEILAANKAKYSKHTLDRLYLKTIPKWERDPAHTQEDKVKAIRAAFDRTQVAESILKRNLPNLYSHEKAASWRMLGRAVDRAQTLVKRAAETFSPDLKPEEVIDTWLSFDFGFEKAAAEFDPDMTPEDLRESYNSIYGKAGPRLASMRAWPKHWLDDQDNQGWLQWYENYSAGRRSDTDDKQKERWKSFKSRHGAQFVAQPTPRRAYALVNWAIDPLKLLPPGKVEKMQEDMESYRRQEYVKWYLNRHDFDDTQRERLGRLARKRGAKVDEKPGDGVLMTLALDGIIQPEDL